MTEPASGDRLPAPLPAAGRAAVSPSALALAGAGAVGGLLLGGVVPALVLGAGLWAVRVAVASARAAGRRRRARRPETIDPYAVPDPWRRFVRDSITAQSRFDQAVSRSQAGPLRDRLEQVARRVDDGVRECWRVAHLGAALDAALTGLNPDRVSLELRQFQDQRRAAGAAGAAPSSERSDDALDQTEAALASQLQAARRVEAASQRTTDRLRVLTAELNAAVAAAVELSLDSADAAAAGELAGSVDSVVGEIEALRQALEETVGSPAPGNGNAAR